MKVASSILLLSYASAVKSDNVLYLTNLTCDESYPVTVSNVDFSCEEGCGFGSSGNFQSSMSYSNIDVEDLYTTALINFTAYTNQSAYTYQVTDAGFTQQMFFGSMVDLCENYTDDSACYLEAGTFSSNFNYSIPSAGDLNQYFSGYTVQSSVKIYDYYNNMALVGDCLALLTTQAPVSESPTYQTVGSDAYFYAFAAAAAILMVYMIPHSSDKKDEKKIDLLNKSFEDNDPDVIERERSVFKGSSRPTYDGGYDFDTEALSPVHEENSLAENKTETEQIVTEEIPWPSRDETAYYLPGAPISEITEDVFAYTSPSEPVVRSPSNEEEAVAVEETVVEKNISNLEDPFSDDRPEEGITIV